MRSRKGSGSRGGRGPLIVRAAVAFVSEQWTIQRIHQKSKGGPADSDAGFVRSSPKTRRVLKAGSSPSNRRRTLIGGVRPDHQKRVALA